MDTALYLAREDARSCKLMTCAADFCSRNKSHDGGFEFGDLLEVCTTC